jgi:hypothetical protein
LDQTCGAQTRCDRFALVLKKHTLVNDKRTRVDSGNRRIEIEIEIEIERERKRERKRLRSRELEIGIEREDQREIEIEMRPPHGDGKDLLYSHS